jgi:hypothetical protein
MFATETISPKGKVVKHYRTQNVKTPLACLAQLAVKNLVGFKAGVTLTGLLAQTDLAAAQAMQKAKAELFAMFNKPKVKLRL